MRRKRECGRKKNQGKDRKKSDDVDEEEFTIPSEKMIII